ncbi:DEAD/DEAH box helicase family protein [Ferroplasma acidarmanus]|uniref:Uncharacterized protein n=1 Tax=Ferroplasma acidarmanus Fer1 TaxID=333146 RepID=S0ALV8_FERAC|nr:DEAD/DEAH box helicase family protein [Ferroplasma acidarmanus]AGO59991.1 hypothetical protein FACI_IFERC00001G0011 [Ferroplasma acidarmanus Fer1]
MENSLASKMEIRDYQQDAVNKWKNHNMNGIFEMATGTGKTYTSILCINELIQTNEKLLIVIACPYVHLLTQWQKSLNNVGLTSIFNTNITKWKEKLGQEIIKLRYSSKILIILTTHNTLANNEFLNILSSSDYPKFLIVDEVHDIGSAQHRLGLSEMFQYRLGLSATPQRYFDEEGTEFILNYFSGIVYTFSLKEALEHINPDTNKSFIVHYDYIPYFIDLTPDEGEKYIEITKKLVKIYNVKEFQDVKERLLFKRQNILKNATNKYNILNIIMDNFIKSYNTSNTLIYCSPQQIDEVQNLLSEKNIINHKFTMIEGTKPDKKYNGLSERDFILHKFSEGAYSTLVAMKCLDEGVDVPSIKNAILMSSSGNLREWYQRMGRILRRDKNKDHAYIYDIIVKPVKSALIEYKNIEYKLFEKELSRYTEFISNADNRLECWNKLHAVKKELGMI